METGKDLPCSVYCQKSNIPIIGSALKPEKEKTFGGYILLEVDKITERKLLESNDEVGEIAKTIDDALKKTDRWYRFQVILSDATFCQGGFRKIIQYVPIDNTNLRFTRNEIDIPENKIMDAITLIIEQKTQALTQFLTQNKVHQDILVCTHALRDRCCGRFGYPIYQHLKSVLIDQNIRVWRSNHITGHRAAPTMLQLPEGRYWGYLEPSIAERIVTHQLLSDFEIDKHYRGLVGLTASEQLAERLEFMKNGLENTKITESITSLDNENNTSVEIRYLDDKYPKETYTVTKNGKANVGQTKCAFLRPFDLLEIE